MKKIQFSFYLYFGTTVWATTRKLAAYIFGAPETPAHIFGVPETPESGSCQT
jgi:hypothetical protein